MSFKHILAIAIIVLMIAGIALVYIGSNGYVAAGVYALYVASNIGRNLMFKMKGAS